MSKAKDRQIIFDKYGGKCAYCGCELQKGWHVDHIEPIRRVYKDKIKDGELVYGKNGMRVQEYDLLNPELDVIDNKIPSCPPCNINKHSASVEQFRDYIAQYVKSLNTRNVQYQMAKKYGLIQETGNPVKFYFETL